MLVPITPGPIQPMRVLPGVMVGTDMGIALAESKRMGLSLPGLALGEQLYMSVKARGFGRNGTHALMLALSEMSGIDWRNRK